MKGRNKTLITFLFLTCSVALLLSASSAQADDDKWAVDLRLYGLGAGMEGTVGAGNRTADVNLSFGDILSNLEFGFMGETHAHKGPWSVNGDVIYSGLGMENDAVKADVNQWIVGMNAGYEFAHNVEFFGGVRINALRNTFTFKRVGVEVEPKKSWVDPIVGFRLTENLNDKWSIDPSFDFGGFSAGSKFTYQLQILVSRHFSKRTALDFGYRILGINYDKGEGVKRFLYDVTISGPEAGLTLSL